MKKYLRLFHYNFDLFFVRNPAYLLAFFLLTMFTDKLAALSRDDGHVRGRILHRDDRLWLQQENKYTRTFRENKSSSKVQTKWSSKAQNIIKKLLVLVTCLVKTILPSRKGGTRLWTSRWTLAALSSSKSSSTSNLCTTPLVSIRLVSHLSLSWDEKHSLLRRQINTEVQFRLN